ncbi:DUF3311 domain-containing protein [Caldibacillus thermolactis]|uniref:DUF3311 domain-containing protein n=1 Tax=Pallidibacillus thermolactis TaxID=251051 RepID=A0ABT2WFC3_9BACI|nr:DUF3311 domain-containing protein [Pallidibacillus thermolactis]MCU9594396.1 DUF3311 domain-containing protein [Pallidibacillus thermolactis]MCU9600616.1 DUF3311 domain-containing protein [Pallidibacillus thermolactis subsp. kokeshiiformis]MED1673042.1 DUF3311 domain-containing protein [Pallidibacillus thermolactis subsp. kokeshiiformis]
MKPLYFIAFIPVLAFLVGVPLANRIEPMIMGLPFSIFWIVLWVILSSLTIFIMYTFDDHKEEESN